MTKVIDTSLAEWGVDSRDDPRFAGYAQRLVAAAAVLGGQRDILVVHIDNWFGVCWLGFPKVHFRIRGGLQSAHLSKVRETSYRVPPFHPNRVLSERRYEMSENGVLRGPLEPSRQLHHDYRANEDRARTFRKTFEPGIYAWCSGNTKASDRAALMVYTHTRDDTSAWYLEFRKTDGWRLSRRTCIGDADWRRLLEIGGLTEWE